MSSRSFLVVAAASLVGVAFSATAQAAPSEEIVAKIPFPFVARSQAFPAGNYVISVGTSSDPDLVTIQGPSGTQHLLFLGVPAGESREGAPPTLEFGRVGSRYYLKQVDQGNGAVDFEIPGAALAQDMTREPLSPALSAR
jgi:hypothetical protein